MQTNNDVDVLIIGAGFAGIYQLHRALKSGYSAHVVERGGDVGGTWYWNRYPGARCDVPSLAYSVSYLPDLDQEWTWPEVFAHQSDILKYQLHIVERLGLRPYMTFNTEVTDAVWDRGRWQVKSQAGETWSGRFLVMATGTLVVPKRPDIPGLEQFEGRWFHTGRWPHETVDFTGRRVAVIGTGSTGIQVVPVVAEQAAHLHVFQRTPKFSAPLANRRLSEEEIAKAKEVYPQARKAHRKADYGYHSDRPTYDLSQMPREEADRLMQAAWDQGRFSGFLTSYAPNLGIVNQAVNDILSDFARRKIREVVKDPKIAETLTPRGYPIGVNRLCRDTGYYEAFNRDNVTLVDTLKDPLAAITEHGIDTQNDSFAFDDIIFATGYDAMTGPITSINVVGPDGRTVKEAWADGARTYLGVAVSGFPNLFTITGPGGPSVLSNAIVTIEQNVDFVTNMMDRMRETGKAVVNAERGAEAAWMQRVHDVSQQSLYRDAHKANAWYTGANVPGKKVQFLPFAGGVGEYEIITDEIVADNYRGFQFT
ncbi:flavin-containing monooxygenase [Agrobacterium pusense]|uniref:flavin-containing monooxygenase n=1 Tax=Agrobacterium pusense TaxID=648995 RepID=UPI003FD04F36